MAARRLALVLAAAVLSFGVAHVDAPAAAAARGLDVRAGTTYTVRPGARLVHVSTTLVVRNVTPDRGRVRYFYVGYGLGVHKEATRIVATSGGRRLAVTSRPRGTFLELQVRFGTRVFRGQSFRFEIDYDLPDAGARSAGDTRVGLAFAGFYAYAFGEELGQVQVVLPPGFKLSLQEGSPLRRSVGPGGTTVLTALGIREPSRWWTYVGADRPAALRTETFRVTVGERQEQMTVKAWPEDRVWAQRVRRRLEAGVPIMAQLVGLPWPVPGTLEVLEVHSPLLGGYAGVYEEVEDEIRITEDPNDLVVLHEASHAWFNGSLIRGRWIVEGLADEYAGRTLARLGSTGYGPDPVDRASRAAFPLNEWPRPRGIRDTQTEAREEYGYNASWYVVRQLVSEVGEDGMRRVFKAAATNEIPYVGEGTPEPMFAVGGGAADWRRLLDLLEERGRSTQASSLFEKWVLGKADLPKLRERVEAREAYADLLEAGRGWRAPFPIRYYFTAWEFDKAAPLIKDAREVLERRQRVEELAASLRLTTTSALENAYEGAAGDLQKPRRLADEQLATLGAIGDARRAFEAPRDPVAALGLLGETPERSLDEARNDFGRDDLAGARDAAASARRVLEGAPARGTERLGIAAAVALAVLLVLVLATWMLVSRRRRRVAYAAAPAVPAAETRGASAGTGPDAGPAVQAPPATLPAHLPPEEKPPP